MNSIIRKSNTGILTCNHLGVFGNVARLRPEVYLWHLVSQPATLQVTTLVLKVAGVAHVVDAASAGCTKSELISTFRPLTLWILPLIGPHGEQL